MKHQFKNGDKCRCPEIFGDEILTYIGKAPDLVFSNDCVVLRDGECIPVRESNLIPCFPVPEDFEKRMHWYLVSYKITGRDGGFIGHKHINADEELIPPRDTIDICKVIAEKHGCKKEEVIITSMFYFGHVVAIDPEV